MEGHPYTGKCEIFSAIFQEPRRRRKVFSGFLRINHARLCPTRKENAGNLHIKRGHRSNVLSINISRYHVKQNSPVPREQGRRHKTVRHLSPCDPDENAEILCRTRTRHKGFLWTLDAPRPERTQTGSCLTTPGLNIAQDRSFAAELDAFGKGN